MSLSSRRPSTLGLVVLAVCGASGAVSSTQAAQTYVQPRVDLRAETNSNINLDPDGSPDGSVEGYIADFEALFGIMTQRSETSLRPRIRLQEYPDRDERERVEGFLDLVSRYEWESSRLDLVGKASQQDSYNFDTRSGEFDPLDPVDPLQGTGQALIGETRTSFSIRPDYLYDFSERTSGGIGGQWQSTRYDADSGQSNQVDYDYVVGNAQLRWALDPRSSIRAGAYASNYDPKEGFGESDSYGVSLGFQRDLSERAGFEVTALYETNDPRYSATQGGGDRESGLGGRVSGFYRGEVSVWRVSAAHEFTPGNNGQVEQTDSVRLQYLRNLSERLSLTSAARYTAEESLSGNGGSDDEKVARFDLNVKWMISRTWYVQGGYAYVWKDRGSQDGDADNNRFFVSAGYQGLGKQ